MAEVITRLKVDNAGYDQKIKQAQRSLDQFGIKGTEVGQKMSGLGRALTANIGSLSKWSVGLGAASAALKVAGDAFKHNEELMDSWNAAMDGARSSYSAFLTALNTSDFSSFFSNIRDVINAAREAYNSLDELGTYQAFAARGNAKNRAAYSEAVANYKENKSAENRAAVEAASAAIIADLQEQKTLTAQAYTDAVKKLALEQGMTGSNVTEFVSMFSNKSWAELQSAKAGYAKGKGANMATYWNGYQVQGNDLLTRNAAGVVTERRAMTEAEKAAFRFARALNEVTDEEIKNAQSLGAQEFQLGQAIGDQRRNAARMLGESSVAKTPTSTPSVAVQALEGSIDAQQEKVRALRAEWTAAAGDDARAAIKVQLDEATEELERMLGKVKEIPQEIEKIPSAMERATKALAEAKSAYLKGETGKNPYADANAAVNLQGIIDRNALEGIDIPVGVEVTDEEWQALVARINEQLAALDLPPITLDVETGNIKGVTDEMVQGANSAKGAWAAASSAVGSVGSALQSIEDPGAKVVGIVAQAIAQVAAGYGAALAKAGATGDAGGPWGWVAFAATGAAAMVSSIAAIKAATEYHSQGDIVGKGLFQPRGTDVVPAMLTPGEEVLTARDWRHQNNIGRYLQGSAGGYGGGNAQPYVNGEQIWLGLNNYLKRTGRGEVVTSRR